jgi:hypothetical protein
MQRAARKVAQENTRLRNLLARHGVSQAQVDSYLQSNDANEHSSIQSARVPFRTPIETSTSVLRPMINVAPISERDHHTNDCHIDTHADNIAHPSRHHTFDEQAITANPQLSQTVLNGCNQTSGTLLRNTELRHEKSNDAGNDSTCPNTSDCFCPPTSPHAHQPLNAGLEISCEAAATIIIEMRGDGDVESVRAALGCAGRENCNVRNSTVLQIMDEG